MVEVVYIFNHMIFENVFKVGHSFPHKSSIHLHRRGIFPHLQCSLLIYSTKLYLKVPLVISPMKVCHILFALELIPFLHTSKTILLLVRGKIYAFSLNIVVIITYW